MMITSKCILKHYKEELWNEEPKGYLFLQFPNNLLNSVLYLTWSFFEVSWTTEI